MKKLALKKYHIRDLVLKLNSRLCFSPPFTGGKKHLEFPLDILILSLLFSIIMVQLLQVFNVVELHFLNLLKANCELFKYSLLFIHATLF